MIRKLSISDCMHKSKKFKSFAYYAILASFFLLASCVYGNPDEFEKNLENYNGNIVIESSRHLAFPDLIRYEGTWYVILLPKNHTTG